MNAPKLRAVRTREQTIEEALRALISVMSDQTIPRRARDAAWAAFKEIHGSRSPKTIARMEREFFERLSPMDQALFLRSGGKL